MNPSQQLRQRSLQSLAHPISVGAIVILLVNDHWLRWHHPSWWSGKIGDFVWLIFAPFLLMLLLSYVWPKQKIHQAEKIAFIGTGLIFALGNSIPFFHQFLVWLFQQIAGWKPLMILDPTDLLMMPGLFVGWKIWQFSLAHKNQALIPLSNNLIGRIMLVIGTFATMANSPSYDDYGVYCVAQYGESIVAYTSDILPPDGGPHATLDGGITWTKLHNSDGSPSITISDTDTKQPCVRDTYPWQSAGQTTSNIQWRIKNPRRFIEQSLDSGESWRIVYKFPAGEQVRKYYYRPAPQNWGPQGRIIKPGGPYNAVVDQTTGNLILSMGFEGVIVITPAGEVTQAAIGPYHFVDITKVSLVELLNKEIILALILGFWGIAIASMPLWTKSYRRTVFQWVLKATMLVSLLYALFAKEELSLHIVGLVLVSIWSLLFFAILAIIGLRKIVQVHSWQLARQIIVKTIIVSLAFLIPLVLWARGILPYHQLASVIGLVLALRSIKYNYDLVYRETSTKYQT